jgi:hypothetical protein
MPTNKEPVVPVTGDQIEHILPQINKWGREKLQRIWPYVTDLGRADPLPDRKVFQASLGLLPAIAHLPINPGHECGTIRDTFSNGWVKGVSCHERYSRSAGFAIRSADAVMATYADFTLAGGVSFVFNRLTGKSMNQIALTESQVVYIVQNLRVYLGEFTYFVLKTGDTEPPFVKVVRNDDHTFFIGYPQDPPTVSLGGPLIRRLFYPV